MRAWRVVAASLVIFAYFAAAPFGYAAFALLQLVPSKDRDVRARQLQRVLQRAFTFMHAVLRTLGIIDFDPKAIEGEISEGPCVIVANHPTVMDTSAMLATLGLVTCAVKPTIFHAFWAHPLLAQAGHFGGVSLTSPDVDRVMDDALDRLARGHRVLMFPEGTRSPPGGLHRFGRVPFEIAVRANVPVVPVAIECSPRWLSKDRSLLRPPAAEPRLRMRALAPVFPSAAGASSRALRDMVGNAIRAQLDPAGSLK